MAGRREHVRRWAPRVLFVLAVVTVVCLLLATGIAIAQEMADLMYALVVVLVLSVSG